ncbi:MAG: acyl-[acyl-carrier-protein]--UDP-N-acetylglucosamine O-acyltransferase, partial [Candidatus Eisenbacteria bacterium]|nr:acyl-[acyl-carrier-protein]--UDP-N-acetylglucosamine O-acyltransferase [Candidatus Eisenbacteria bacterium]
MDHADENVFIDPSARVDRGAELGRGVHVGPWCWVGPQVRLGDGCRLDSMVRLDGDLRIGSGNHFHHGAVAGTAPQDLKYRGAPSQVVIGEGNVFREYCTVNRATAEGEVTRIGSFCLVMAYAHIAHNCVVGDHVILANSANLAGHVEMGDYAIIGGVTP